jgi:uncharacterized protein YciI
MKGRRMTLPLYVLYYVPGPRWQAGRSVSEQALDAHRAYMEELYERDELLMGGPLLDNAGGLIILRVPDQQVAEHIMAHDPAVRAGIVKGSVHPWLPERWRTPSDTQQCISLSRQRQKD